MNWEKLLQEIKATDDYHRLWSKVQAAYCEKKCFPKKENIFRAFELCPFEDLKVVILGQDPYHKDNQADGLSFSVPNSVKIPPSLRNILGELYQDLGETRLDSDLSDWAKQGVLLLNATLTVEAHRAGSHQKWGWENFTDQIIRRISDEKEGLVFVLWGNFAQKKARLINPKKHLVLQSAHPSPLSAYRGFFGSQVFSKINQYLKSHNSAPIRWV